MTSQSTTKATVDAPADAVFATITNIGRLPEWNSIITRVVEQPPALTPGAEWVVELHAMGQSWQSRARVEEIDTAGRRFAYRSCSDDGNPSYALWRWEVTETPTGSEVRVSWDLHPATFLRRHLLAKIRSRQLRSEVPTSISRIRDVATNRA
jgi:uncharacterized membrane protein